MVVEDGRAWRAGADPAERVKQVREAHDAFVSTGETDHRVRPLVVESWRRSLRGGLDPERSLAPVDLHDDELELCQSSHPLAGAMPVIRRLLVEDGIDTGLLVAVTDAAGRLMWVEGPSQMRRRAESIHFVAGADWSEASAGTNAPGTALALDQPVQIVAAEHLARPVTPWSCSAAPIHDPDTGAILGALDLTGGDEVAGPHTLSIVRATVAAVESEIRLMRLTGGGDLGTPASAAPGDALLRMLGRGPAVIEGAHGLTRLSLRHSELVLLLAHHREGLAGEQLAVGLSDQDLAPVTLRAEMSRLRAVLAPLSLTLEARPYRLDRRLRTDVDVLRERLREGDVGAAVELYRGPLLLASDAPEVVRLRRSLHEDLRAALIAAGDPDALLRFADTEHGRLDWQVWQAASSVLGECSSRWPSVREHLATLERELGANPGHRREAR